MTDINTLARQLLELAGEATPGEWEGIPQADGDGWLGGTSRCGDTFFPNPADAQFIAASRNIAPQLCEFVIEAVEVLKEEVKDNYFGGRARDLLKKWGIE